MKRERDTDRMVRRSGRSRSRGRPERYEAPVETPKTPKAAKAAAKAEEPKKKLDFVEGDAVMARWPGTALYFKSKVTYVRDDDNEYDVQFEDGTIYTLKAKEVKKMEAIPTAKKTPSRSRSRGRSPSRKSKASPARTPSEKKTSR